MMKNKRVNARDDKTDIIIPLIEASICFIITILFLLTH